MKIILPPMARQRPDGRAVLPRRRRRDVGRDRPRVAAVTRVRGRSRDAIKPVWSHILGRIDARGALFCCTKI